MVRADISYIFIMVITAILLAASLEDWTAGKSSAVNSPTMKITTNISINVNALRILNLITFVQGARSKLLR